MTIYGDAYNAGGGLSAQAADHEHHGRAGREGLVHRRPSNTTTPRRACLAGSTRPIPRPCMRSRSPRTSAGHRPLRLADRRRSLREYLVHRGEAEHSAIGVYFPGSGRVAISPCRRRPESPVAGGRSRQQHLVHRAVGAGGPTSSAVGVIDLSAWLTESHGIPADQAHRGQRPTAIPDHRRSRRLPLVHGQYANQAIQYINPATKVVGRRPHHPSGGRPRPSARAHDRAGREHLVHRRPGRYFRRRRP